MALSNKRRRVSAHLFLGPDCVVQQHYFLHFYPGGNQFGFGATGAPGNGVYTTPDKLPLNAWTHVSVSFDGTNATIYINGVAEATHAMTLDPNTVPLRSEVNRRAEPILAVRSMT
ncbi:MAG: hypothetical protein IPK98_15905 [Chloracidobacterium sp.]|nr:hypothetical protein [Chloracidobacterium sp.]